jgi:phosphatidylglycerol:prolipoprotein diacylglycerol transferase
MLSFISWNFDPELFDLDINGHHLPLRWYGVLFAAGFIIAQLVFYYVYRKDGKSRAAVDTLTIYVIVATIVGARLGHYLFYEWPMLLQSPISWLTELITPPFSGLASHGATICVVLSVYLYSRLHKDQPFLWVLDRLAIVTPIVGAMIRLGNLLNSEIYGVPTSLPWGFLFERETDPLLLPIVPRHPTQLYEALFCVFLFGLTFYLWKVRRFTIPSGAISGIFIFLLFLFRFCIEFLKNDQVEFESDYLLNMGQVLSLPAMAFGLLILFYAYRNRERVSRVAS